jgi:hypothetical protein
MTMPLMGFNLQQDRFNWQNHSTTTRRWKLVSSVLNVDLATRRIKSWSIFLRLKTPVLLHLWIDHSTSNWLLFCRGRLIRSNNHDNNAVNQVNLGMTFSLIHPNSIYSNSSWIIDSDATIHPICLITVKLKLQLSVLYITLGPNFILKLHNVLYIPTFHVNLIYISYIWSCIDNKSQVFSCNSDSCNTASIHVAS